jgi:hypothetical protein
MKFLSTDRTHLYIILTKWNLLCEYCAYREIYTQVLLESTTYKWKEHNGKLERILKLSSSPPSLSISRSKSRYEADLAVFVVSFMLGPVGLTDEFTIITKFN